VTAILYRQLDANGDYQFGRGLQNFAYGAAAVAQAVKTGLLLLRGEWWEDTSVGLPLFQGVLAQRGTPQSLQTMDPLIQQQIAGTEGVASVQNYQRTYGSAKRTLTVSCQITTTDGQTAPVEVTF